MTHYRWENIRALLIEGFPLESLLAFCHDSPDFRVVYHQLSESDDKLKLITRLIDHARQKLLLDALLAWAEMENPARYESHKPYRYLRSDEMRGENHPRGEAEGNQAGALKKSGGVITLAKDGERPQNPFHYNLPTPPEDFVGRWPLVDRVIDSLCSPRADSWAIIGGRRFGKSSVLKVMQARLSDALPHHVSGERLFFPFIVDLKRCETHSAGHIYAGISRILYRSLRPVFGARLPLKDTLLHAHCAEANESLSFYQFEDSLDDLAVTFETHLGPLRLLLFLDEAESITRFAWAETLFNQLRALIYDGILADTLKLVLTGAANITQVRHQGSPLLNAVKIAHLHCLDAAAIEVLIERGGPSEKPVREAVQAQCGGHPFVAQYFLHHLWHDGLHQATLSDVERVARQFQQERANDLQGWWEAVGDSGQAAYLYLSRASTWVDEVVLRQASGPSQHPFEQGLAALCYHGLIKQDENRQRYQVAGQAFCAWVGG